MKQRNTAIDLVKYIAALMIVAIHTNLFADLNDTLNFLFVHVLCRLAVPFFAVSSGYLLTQQLGEPVQPMVLIRHEKKLLLLYGIWTVLYLFFSIPMWIEIGWLSPFAFVDYMVGALTKGSHYHLWYLWGMIYTLPAFYLLVRLVNRKYLPAITGLLWLLKVVTYGYAPLLPSAASGIVALLQKADAFLCLLPLLLTGAIIAGEKDRPRMRYGISFVVSFALLCAEAFGLRKMGQEAVSYIVFTLPTAYCLFHLILDAKIPLKDATGKHLAFVSLFVYCVHPMLVESTDNIIHSSILHFLFVSAGSTALGWAILFISNKFKLFRKKAKSCSN